MFIDWGPFLSVCCFQTMAFAVVVTGVVFPSVASVKSAVLLPCAEPSSHQLSQIMALDLSHSDALDPVPG